MAGAVKDTVRQQPGKLYLACMGYMCCSIALKAHLVKLGYSIFIICLK